MIVLSVSLFIVACTSPKEKLSNKINEGEKKLFADSVKSYDQTSARELVTAYIDFTKSFPADSVSPLYLFKAAEVANGILKLPVEALEYYNWVVEKYPTHEKASVSLFLEGFISENNLKNNEKAKKYYEEFLSKYPDHSLSKDVKFSLEHLGMSDEDLIKMFEEKNKETPAN